MKKLPLIIFLALLASAIFTSLHSLRRTEQLIAQDLDYALEMTKQQMTATKIDADTLCLYRNFITIDEVRDTACLAMRAVLKDDSEYETILEAESGCSFATMFMLSDQRASFFLTILAVLWLLGSVWLTNRKPVVYVEEKTLSQVGDLRYDAENSLFLASDGKEIHLTPMQRQLMEMFVVAKNHVLTKKEICDSLWPKKPDASDTLYTLIKRLKPIVEANSNLKIESDRGRAYRLINK